MHNTTDSHNTSGAAPRVCFCFKGHTLPPRCATLTSSGLMLMFMLMFIDAGHHGHCIMAAWAGWLQAFNDVSLKMGLGWGVSLADSNIRSSSDMADEISMPQDFEVLEVSVRGVQ